jgi:HK97 family phage major capsid protein
MERWQTKAEKASALIEQVKQELKTVEKAEDAIRLQNVFKAAVKLSEDAGKERKELETARLNQLMVEHEKNAEVREQGRITGENERFLSTYNGTQGDNRGGRVSDGSLTLAQRMQPGIGRMLASQRAVDTIDVLHKAALAEGTGSTGGFLVVPAYLQELFAETRRQGNALRSYGWLNIHPIESNQALIPRGSGAATAAWVSENTAKPSADQAFTQITVNIFTAAGISKQSKQMAMDSSPTVLDLSTRELGTLLGNLEEQAIINGTASGQPRGILNVTGLAVPPQTGSDTANGCVATSATAQAIIDQILNCIVAIASQYFAPPNGVLMHPRRLGYLLKAKDTATNYIFNMQGSFRAPNFLPALQSTTRADGATFGALDTPPVSFLGIPLGTSVNIPTNQNFGTSGGSDQDVILVANWNEAHWFQRQDVTMDTTDVAGTSWEQNQVWIRGEERVGFTAERYPTAFGVVHGKGLAAANV